MAHTSYKAQMEPGFTTVGTQCISENTMFEISLSSNLSVNGDDVYLLLRVPWRPKGFHLKSVEPFGLTANLRN